MINLNELKPGNWISDTNGIYEVMKIYKTAGGTFYKVREVAFDLKSDDHFVLCEEYDITPEDIKKCHKFFK